MRINLSRRLRVVVYVANIFGTPVAMYARSKGWIGDLELNLWAAEVAAAFTLAGLNVSKS